MQNDAARVLPKVETLVVSSQAAVEDGRVRIAELTTKVNALVDTSQKQLKTVDEFLTDAAARGRVQMDRAEMFLDDTMNRAQDTVAMVHGTVITPLRQINGVATGVRAAIQFFLRGNRPSPDRATVDEEMFI
jgi:ABC-type transporter Mla subunit MlaD